MPSTSRGPARERPRPNRKSERNYQGQAPARYQATPISTTAQHLTEAMGALEEVRPYLLHLMLLEGNSWASTAWVDGLAPSATASLRKLMYKNFGMEPSDRTNGRAGADIVKRPKTKEQERLLAALQEVIAAADAMRTTCAKGTTKNP